MWGFYYLSERAKEILSASHDELRTMISKMCRTHLAQDDEPLELAPMGLYQNTIGSSVANKALNRRGSRVLIPPHTLYPLHS